MTGDGESERIDTVLGALGRAPPRSPPPAFAPGAELGGRYTIVRLLGRGGMGVVYRARDAVLGKDVALKFLGGVADLERLRDEVRLAHEVTHRNVCRTYDLEQLGEHWVVKMELVEGESLAERIAAGPLALAEVLAIGGQVAAGLEAAHERGIVHGDLKPHNVMLEHGTSRAVLTDFGLAHAGEATASAGGTPGYSAPEQLRGESVDRRADVFAFGCLLRAMVGDRDAPRWLARRIARCLDPDPARRPVRVTLARRRARWPLALALLAIAVVAGVLLARGRAAPEWRPVLRDVAADDEYTVDPVFSPDGTRLAYASNRSGRWRIYVQSLADGRVSPIGPGTLALSNPRWTKHGTAIVGATVTQSTESVHWFELPLVDGAAGIPLADAPPRACGQGSVALRPGTPGCPACEQLVLHEPDGGERELVSITGLQYLRAYACDAAGRRVAYAISNGPEPSELWVMTLADGARRKLADRGLRPAIHPDGRSIVATLERDGRKNLWELPVDGSAPRQLTFGQGPDHTPDISPDGRRLVFVTGELIWESTRITAYRLPGGAARTLAGRRATISHLRLSPDGKHLAGQAGSNEIVLVSTGGGDEHVLGPGSLPAFTPDGRDLVFAVGIDPATVRIMPSGGGAARTLATFPGHLRRIEVDDQRVAHIWDDERDGDVAWQLPLAGGPPVREAPARWIYISHAPVGGWRVAFRFAVDAHVLAPGMALDDPSAAVLPDIAIDGVSWLPDGTAFTYIRGQTVHRFDVATRNDVVLFELPQSEWNDAVLSRDGSELYVTVGVAQNRTSMIVNFGDR